MAGRALIAPRAEPAQVGRLASVSAIDPKLSAGASGAIRRFAGGVAAGSAGHPMLEGIDYWRMFRHSPS
ncbi:DUF7677 family protein, partial [Cellulomonas sp.]|uniref:DUF7677 family protein n=1 Tax=Cellulomonas sp. TaxID=40001 RepID=UPI003BB99FB9